MAHSENFKDIYNKSILINKVLPKSPFFWPTVAANKEEENFRPKLLDSGKNEDLSYDPKPGRISTRFLIEPRSKLYL